MNIETVDELAEKVADWLAATDLSGIVPGGLQVGPVMAATPAAAWSSPFAAFDQTQQSPHVFTVNVQQVVVREEADIHRIAQELYRLYQWRL